MSPASHRQVEDQLTQPRPTRGRPVRCGRDAAGRPSPATARAADRRPPPDDRIHVTCGSPASPDTWVAQCRSGALIVLPRLPTGYAGHQLRLHVGADGRAISRFHGGCGYMMMRSQRSTWNAHHADQAPHLERAARSTRHHDRRSGAASAAGGPQPGVTHLVLTDPIADTSSLLMFQTDRSDGSWAAAGDLTDRTTCITQYGYRSLWDEAEAVFAEWLERGLPARTPWGDCRRGPGSTCGAPTHARSFSP